MAVRPRLRSLSLIAALIIGGLANLISAPAAHAATAPGTLTEFAIPNSGANLATGADGNLWWGDGANIYRMTTAGSVTTFPVSSGAANFVAPGPDGNMWYIGRNGSSTNVIGRVTPVGGITEFPITVAPRDMQGLTAGPDGNMWILMQGVNTATDPLLVKVTTAGVATAYVEDFEGRTSVIVAGPNGRIWWSRGNGQILNSVDPADPSNTRVTTLLPNGTNLSTNHDLAVGSDNNLWFTSSTGCGASSIGRTTPSGVAVRWPDRKDGCPTSIALGPDGNVWFTGLYDSGNLISRIHPDGTIDRIDVSSASSTLSFPGAGLVAGPDGNMWVFEDSGTTIARISPGSPSSAVVSLASGFSDPNVTLTGPGSTLTFAFTGPTPASATDSSGLGLFDSGVQSFTNVYSTTLKAAGVYSYADSLQPAHTGTVTVPPTATPVYTLRGSNFMVQWASDAPPPGFVYDVQAQVPGGSFANYKIGVTDISSLERPGAPAGTFAYRARMRRTSDNVATGYSPEVRIRYGWGTPAGFTSSATQRSVFRPSDGSWWVDDGGPTSNFFGLPGDLPVPGDYGGNGSSDRAVYRPDVGGWYIDDGGPTTVFFGLSGDIPVPADYTGDGKADISVFRPSIGGWYLHPSEGGPDTVSFLGLSGDIPVPADYTGDGKVDLAVFRPSTGAWYIHPSGGGPDITTNFGLPGDIPVPGYYDGDLKTDIAVFRPSTGAWYVRYSGGATDSATFFGLPGDIPAPGDYENDGRTDLAVYRPSTQTWYQRYSSGISDTANAFGLSGDVPLPLPTAIENTFFP